MGVETQQECGANPAFTPLARTIAALGLQRHSGGSARPATRQPTGAAQQTAGNRLEQPWRTHGLLRGQPGTGSGSLENKSNRRTCLAVEAVRHKLNSLADSPRQLWRTNRRTLQWKPYATNSSTLPRRTASGSVPRNLQERMAGTAHVSDSGTRRTFRRAHRAVPGWQDSHCNWAARCGANAAKLGLPAPQELLHAKHVPQLRSGRRQQSQKIVPGLQTCRKRGLAPRDSLRALSQAAPTVPQLLAQANYKQAGHSTSAREPTLQPTDGAVQQLQGTQGQAYLQEPLIVHCHAAGVRPVLGCG